MMVDIDARLNGLSDFILLSIQLLNVQPSFISLSSICLDTEAVIVVSSDQIMPSSSIVLSPFKTHANEANKQTHEGFVGDDGMNHNNNNNEEVFSPDCHTAASLSKMCDCSRS